MQRRSEYIQVAAHSIHISHWGNPSSPALIMWHGLARTGRDFDGAAHILSKDYFVICPDTIGRGLSSWGQNPRTDYSLKSYAEIAEAIIDYYKIEKLRWFGTSMGGLIGMLLAGGVLNERITHLVINDIGPEIGSDALSRIIEYVGSPPSFASMPEFKVWLEKIYAPFGENSEEFWQLMADSSMRRRSDGRITTHYDPEIINQFSHNADELPLWEVYQNISAKILITRGSESDVLPTNVGDKMLKYNDNASLQEIKKFGHAPTFNSIESIDLLRLFLN